MKSRILEVFAVCFALALRADAQTPNITAQPQSLIVNNASAAAFTVVAARAATYQWFFQGATSLPGATNATLSLDDVNSNQAGSYTVVVTSSNNLSVTSAPPAVLTIVPGTIVQFTLSTYAGGGSNSFLAQLFDHDKPATVENFIHYITSGAYSNMFFDRDVADFVLQGGDYVTADRTSNGLNISSITPGANFPSQVDNEFNVGPLIHNRFGTLGMAKISGKPDSATSAFFFNLADNATNLDNQNGGFTVFGRILGGSDSGSNVLQYFNTLSAPTNGIFDYSSSHVSISMLPVNEDGTNEPTDANLFYCDFTFPTPPPVDATPPTVAINFPATNAVFTNAGTLTITGTASDNVGLAEVFCVVTSPTGVSQTNAAEGAANWSLNIGYLEPGTYQVTAYAQDGAGNLSAPVTENFTAMIPAGTLVQMTFSGFPNGSSSNVLVQLFDQEKPATVANFLHYITPAYEFGIFPALPVANMIWDRCLPGFILQGGDYDAPDQTNGLAPRDLASTLTSINNDFTENSSYSPPFAAQVDNEFDTGPLIHNTFGTLAMAKTSGDPDSAANGFFFNLADNSTNLDNQNGGFTVFGRILSGSNVLQYFNTLSKPNQGIFDSTTASTDSSLTDLPVNYNGWGAPADSNLFFATFTVMSPFHADTNPPSVAVSWPAGGQTMTNAEVLAQGTAMDNVAVANVICTCEGSNFSSSLFAAGTTNWAADFGVLPPGTYTNYAYAQDGAGNRSTQASNVFVMPRFPFGANTTGRGTLSANLNPTNTILGDSYLLKATPGKGEVFVSWTSGANAFLNPTLNFTMENGLQLTANFISNNVHDGITITSPAVNAGLTNGTFSIKGKLAASLGSAQVSCQVFSAVTSNSVTTNMVFTASGAWSTPSLSLAPGSYIVQAVAQGAGGHAALLAQKFNVLTPLTVIIHGRGNALVRNGAYLSVGSLYTEGISPGPGQSFLSWDAGGGAFTVQTFPFIMSPGLTFTATLISNSLPGKFTLTSPAANSQVTNRNVTFGGKITSANGSQVVCQLFQNNSPLTSFLPATITGTNWTAPVTNLTMGIYNAVAIATGAAGQTTLATEQFTVNFYPNIAGAYKGLFFDPAVISETNAGFISFQLSASQPLVTGAYALVSGNLTFPLRSYSFSAQMGPTGVPAALATAFAGSLTMSFDVTNFSGQMTGSVTQAGASSPLTAYRVLAKLSANTVPALGHYVLNLEPATPANGPLNGPPGDSFAALTVSADGNLAVAGTMADDSSFAQSTGVFTNGVWPLYASFYTGRGMLIGWETNLPSGESTGALFWIKNRASGVYYTNGLNEQIYSFGTNYVAPAKNIPFQIVFGGGTLPSFVTNDFSFNAAGTMVAAAGTTNKLTGSLVLSTGVLKGSIVNPVNKKTLDFSGIFASPSQGGGGFTLEADAQTGYFDITPVPAQ